MANHSSAKKAIRQIKKRTIINRHNNTKIKTLIKKLETVINANDKNSAIEMFPKIQSSIMQGVKKGIFKINTASRKISRLSARIKKIAA